MREENESILRLNKIEASLLKIKTELTQHMEKTSVEEYKLAWERDILNIREFIMMTNAIKSDIEAREDSACTKFMVQNLSKEFSAKLSGIRGYNKQFEKIERRIHKIQKDLYPNSYALEAKHG